MSKYKKIYENLINRAKDRTIDGYTEKHHIIPKCLGGSNKKENFVKLTAREHFIAHQLLVKIYPENKSLICAVNMMCVYGNGQELRSNNRMYEWLKIKHSKYMSELSKARLGEKNGMFGNKHSEETKQKMSDAHSGENCYFFNKPIEEHPAFGNKHSEETKQKMSDAQKGEKSIWFGKNLSEEHKQKISDSISGENHPFFGKIGEESAFFGKKHSEETKKKMSEKQKGENHPMYGKKHSEETKQKMRAARKKQK